MKDRDASRANGTVEITQPRAKTLAGTELGSGLGVNTPVKSDGTLGTDGMRLRPKLWQNCADCGKPIYFVRLGSLCITCGRKKLLSDTELDHIGIETVL